MREAGCSGSAVGRWFVFTSFTSEISTYKAEHMPNATEMSNCGEEIQVRTVSLLLRKCKRDISVTAFRSALAAAAGDDEILFPVHNIG